MKMLFEFMYLLKRIKRMQCTEYNDGETVSYRIQLFAIHI